MMCFTSASSDLLISIHTCSLTVFNLVFHPFMSKMIKPITSWTTSWPIFLLQLSLTRKHKNTGSHGQDGQQVSTDEPASNVYNDIPDEVRAYWAKPRENALARSTPPSQPPSPRSSRQPSQPTTDIPAPSSAQAPSVRRSPRSRKSPSHS